MFSSWPVAHSHSMFTILLLLVWPGHLENVAVLSPLSPNMGRISICGALVQVVKRFGATNGCSVVPNSWLNEEVKMVNDDDHDGWNEVKFSIFFFETIHQACIIHDLCYSTIGANRTLCDRWVTLFGCRHGNLSYLLYWWQNHSNCGWTFPWMLHNLQHLKL